MDDVVLRVKDRSHSPLSVLLAYNATRSNTRAKCHPYQYWTEMGIVRKRHAKIPQVIRSSRRNARNTVATARPPFASRPRSPRSKPHLTFN